MSDQTFRSFCDLIASNRQAREANVRAMESAPPAERLRWNMQIAAFDEQYREQLDAIDEVPELLGALPRLEQNWPYPSWEALEGIRADLGRLARRTVQQVDAMPLREIVAILRVRAPSQNGPPPSQPHKARRITEANLAKLPRWARVAFAARCARRAQRVLAELAPNVSPDELDGTDLAIRLAEQSAASGRVAEGTEQAATEAFQRAQGQGARERAPEAGPSGAQPGDVLLSAVGEAAAGAAWAAVQGTAVPAYDAYRNASRVAQAVGSTALLDGMHQDFLYLEALAEKEGWADASPVSPDRAPRPRLKLVALHVRGLRAIRKLNLPEDGLGWRGKVPDVIVMGGINGSGKTTLLNFLAEALSLIAHPPPHDNFDAGLPKSLDAQEAWADFEIESYELGPARLRFVVGDEAFLKAHRTDDCWWVTRHGNVWLYGRRGNVFHALQITIGLRLGEVSVPSVVYLPSEDRRLIVPGEAYKAAGRLADEPRFVHRWRPPAEWKQSLEALLYSLRWEDLNAKEEGRFTEVGNFAAYASALRRFTGDSKCLTFEHGELVVKISGSGPRHGLEELSSGEKQMLLLSGELLRHWKPGALILIDEPELHLHPRWQTALYAALRYWQAERGGQVIVATQSAHLADVAGPGSAVLLGMEPL